VTMRPLLACAALCASALVPAAAGATNYPYVQDGPLITFVTDTDAWVTWYTAHHEGTGIECTVEENTPLLGDHNTDTPTVTLSPGGAFTSTVCDRYHAIHLTGLTASTRYSFTLDKPWDAKGGATAAGSFTTAPTAGSGAAVKFTVYGDTRNNVAGGTDTRADHQAIVDAIVANEPDSMFALHTGDLALNLPVVSGDDDGYTAFFAVERTLLSTRPVFFVLGNHETINTTFFDSMFDPARFNGSPHPYYSSFDWGKAHFVLGDSFEGTPTTLGLAGRSPAVSDAQVQWMDADLQAAQAAGQASFLSIHQGPFSHSSDPSSHGGLSDVVNKVIPVMLRRGVLASFAGHDHYYQRGHEGCIDYLVLGGGGAPMYAPDATAPGVAVALEQLSYMVVTVQGSGSASMVVKDVNGAAIDSFNFVVPDPSCGATDGGAPDAGAFDSGPADSGSPASDAGTLDDAGTLNDAGALADAGGVQTINGGCGGCASGGSALPLGLALALLVASRRRRVATHSS
jgi:acid phosphatase type 7